MSTTKSEESLNGSFEGLSVVEASEGAYQAEGRAGRDSECPIWIPFMLAQSAPYRAAVPKNNDKTCKCDDTIHCLPTGPRPKKKQLRLILVKQVLSNISMMIRTEVGTQWCKDAI